MKFIGRRVTVGIGKESSRGAGAVPTYWMPHTDISFIDKADHVDSNEAHGVIDTYNEFFVTSKYAEGSIEGETRDKSLGLLLYSTLGACSSAATGAAYDHTFTISQTNQHQSLGLTVKDPNTTKLFKNVNVNNFELNVEVGEIVKYTADIMSQASVDTTATASIAVENKFVSTMACLRIDSVGGAFSVTPIDLKGFTLTINKNLEKQDVACTYSPDDFLNKNLEVEGSFTLDFDDYSYLLNMLNGDYKALKLTVQNKSVDLGGGLNPTITIILPRVGFQVEPDRGLDDIATQEVSFKAYTDVANSDSSIRSIVLRNGVASY